MWATYGATPPTTFPEYLYAVDVLTRHPNEFQVAFMNGAARTALLRGLLSPPPARVAYLERRTQLVNPGYRLDIPRLRREGPQGGGPGKAVVVHIGVS